MAPQYVVEHLNHLGIVAEVCREIGVADWLGQQEPGNRQQVSVGAATVAVLATCAISPQIDGFIVLNLLLFMSGLR